MSVFDSFARQMASDPMMFDHGSSHGRPFVVPHVEFCAVCGCPAGHPSMDRPFGMFGVSGDFFCSQDCHDSVECRRSAVVFAPDVVACHGVRGNMHVRCPECDFRSVSDASK